MAEQRAQRRLAAILAADIVGYSRLMEADESGTLAQLKALRADLLHPKVAAYSGRIVKTTGDGTLIEFPSAVDAVQHAVDVQGELARRNADAPHGRRIELRMGINIGDIIIEGDDIYGDGVNVASRLEGLAEAGGICVSASVHEQVRNKLDMAFEDMGEQTVKNLGRPVRVYRVRPPAVEGFGVAAGDAPLPLPAKPSIAVLAFANMSGDAEQDYFADGISEDLITSLSHIRWLFVIARNSSFVYRGRAVDVKQVSRDLGVRYVLEGSVRKAGNRIRITAQLVDALTGAHHWAERYDRDVTDIFALQDEIVRQVAAAIEPRLLAAEGIRSQTRPPGDLDAWGMVASAMSRYWRLSAHDVEAAITMLKVAIARHPDYGPAHSMLAFGLVLAGHYGWVPAFEVPKLAIESARRAAELDANDPWAYLALGYVAMVARRTDDAAAQFRRAVDLNPNFAAAHGYFGYALAFDGRSDEAIASLSLAIRMSPHDRQNPVFMAGLAVAHYLANRYDQALEWGRRGVHQYPSAAGYRIVCASLAQTGRIDEARETLARIRELQPHVSLAWVESMVPYTPAQMPHFLDGLRKAGLT